MAQAGQIMTRVSHDLQAEVEIVAALNDVSKSDLLREMIDEMLPKLRQRGEVKQKQSHGLPHGVTPRMEEEAFVQLLNEINESKGSTVGISTRQLLTPRSKALYRFLSIVWQETPGERSKSLLEKLAARAGESESVKDGEKK